MPSSTGEESLSDSNSTDHEASNSRNSSEGENITDNQQLHTSIQNLTLAMAAAVPSSFSIEFFQETKGKFERWLQRLEGAFAIFQISEPAGKRNYLLHYVGPNTFDLICDGIATQKPED